MHSQWLKCYTLQLAEIILYMSENLGLEELNLDCTDVDDVKEALTDKHNLPLSIVVEAQEVTSLEWLSECVEPILVKVLNLQSNQVTEDEIRKSHLYKLTHLIQLSLGANQLPLLGGALLSSFPSSLLILDLSYTENLKFASGAFLSCPQLLQLTIDGCGITSTTHDEAGFAFEDGSPLLGCEGTSLGLACQQSIFFGLVSLMNLSMKENAVETARGFEGLAYFAAQSIHAELRAISPELARANDGSALPSCTLTNLSVAENSLFESSAEQRAFSAWVATTLPSVRTIDGKVQPAYASPTAAIVDRTSAAYRAQRSQQATLSGAGITDNMEREFTAALRGEKDVSVVS